MPFLPLALRGWPGGRGRPIVPALYKHVTCLSSAAVSKLVHVWSTDMASVVRLRNSLLTNCGFASLPPLLDGHSTVRLYKTLLLTCTTTLHNHNVGSRAGSAHVAILPSEIVVTGGLYSFGSMRA